MAFEPSMAGHPIVRSMAASPGMGFRVFRVFRGKWLSASQLYHSLSYTISVAQEWRPDRVKAWAVTGVNWWNEPPEGAPEDFPPGIIMTGELEPNLPRTIQAFQKRNSMGRCVLWCGLKDTEHTIPYHALPLVREFFDAVLDPTAPSWQHVVCGGHDAGQVPSPAVRATWEKLDSIPPIEMELTGLDNE